jgi:hypothetical protein
MTTMMKCGHAANSWLRLANGDKVPACVICAGIVDGAYEVAESEPDLTGRLMRCGYTRRRDGSPHPGPVPSSTSAAFFEYKPDAEFDAFYCGCWGWD